MNNAKHCTKDHREAGSIDFSRRQCPAGVLEQVERSLKPGNRLATLMGAMLGGFIPLASYTIAH